MAALANDWHRCKIDKKLLKSLSKRTDKPALLWFGAYFSLVIALGIAVVLTWNTPWVWPVLLLYSLVWGAAASGSHETCHGTPFRSRWLNETSLWAFCWMVQMEPVWVRWGHAGHHSFTHHDVGDTELSEPNPVGWGRFFMVGTGLAGHINYTKTLIAHAFGRFTPDIRAVIPESEIPKAIRNSRIIVASYIAIVMWALLAQSWLPVALLVAPRLIGGPVIGFLHLTQHTGLQMNIFDHRFSTRSFTASPITRFFYFNMNNHIEHHMFPMVPFYNLPKLAAALKDQMPEPCDGLLGVYREVFGAVARQYREPGYFIKKNVPGAEMPSPVEVAAE
ncbi:MAG: fatty acid desaturase [Pseudomonadota bacterium]